MRRVTSTRKVMFTLWLMVALIMTAGSASAQTTINLWFVGQSQPNVDYYNEVILPSFEEAHPQYKVEVQYIGWGEYTDRLFTGFASGTGPDLFQSGSHMVGTLAENGMARPMDMYLDAWPDYQDFFEGARSSSLWKGKAYGIPLPSAIRGFYYRKDLFDESGFDPEKPPTTWDELKDALMKLTVHDSQGNVTRFGAQFESSNWHPWVAFLYQNDVALTSEDGNTPLFNTPGGLETMEFFVDFMQTQRSFGNLTHDDPRFHSGQYAMYYGGQSHFVPRAMLDDPSVLDHVGIVPPLKKKVQAAISYTDWLAFSAQSDKTEASLELAKWIARTDHHVKLAQNINNIPSRAAAVDSDYVRENRLIREEMALAMPHARRWPFWDGANQQQFAAELLRAVEGEISPQQALQNLATTWVPLTR